MTRRANSNPTSTRFSHNYFSLLTNHFLPVMDTTEILKKIRTLEIKTRGLVETAFAGDYHSVFKGRGMNFEDVREYQPGDEIRAIDWNVTARMGNAFVKKFTEERELTVMLVVDVSASGNFGSTTQSKREWALPNIGIITLEDAETGDQIEINTADRTTRARFSGLVDERDQELARVLRRNNIDAIALQTGKDYLPQLRSFFKQRERRLGVR